MSEEATEFLKQKSPILYAVLQIVLKRLELIATVSIMGLATTVYEHKQNHTQIWQETGPHFQDLVKQVQALQIEVNQLEQKKESIK